MKCPIPIEGNCSPSFQCVRPVIFPADSFCQIFFPTLSFSSFDSVGSFGAELCCVAVLLVLVGGFETAVQLNKTGSRAKV